MAQPLVDLARGTIVVAVRDRQGNVTRIERTTDISTGWTTISASLVTILPLALTTMSTLSTKSAIAANATRAIISHRTIRRLGATISVS